MYSYVMYSFINSNKNVYEQINEYAIRMGGASAIL